MKLLRFGPPGDERPGLLDHSNTLRDLSAHFTDFGPKEISLGTLRYLKSIDPMSLPPVHDIARLGPPLSTVGKFIGIGLNYRDHAAEANMPIPMEPVVFMKASSCLSGPNDPIMLPAGSVKTDWEVELGIVIGRTARSVEPQHAAQYIAGYVVVNDVSEREYQLERGGTWDKGKSYDSFGPIGPWLVTSDEIADPHNLGMWLEVNGKRMQTGNTRTMIFGVKEIVAYLSRFMTLHPGDLITTGTPPGVGMGQKPAPIYLKAGDEISLGIDMLGVQRQKVINTPKGVAIHTAHHLSSHHQPS